MYVCEYVCVCVCAILCPCVWARAQVVAGKDKDEETRLMILLNVPFSPEATAASGMGAHVSSWLGTLATMEQDDTSGGAGRSNAPDPAAGTGGASGLGNGGVGVGGRTLTRMTCASSGEAGRAGAGGKGCALEELKLVTGAYGCGFIDLYQQGNNDMILLHSDHEGVARAKVFASNLNHQANLFLKAEGLNGVCAEWCGGAQPFPDPKPFGVNFPGVLVALSLPRCCHCFW
jgi:hypothetical protein